jgi:hypothetical protein
MRRSTPAQRNAWPCRSLASATPAAPEPYIAQQPRTPSHARRFGPSTLICRGYADALGRCCAAADKRSPIKVYASSGVAARTGNDFDLIGLAWQLRWGAGL